MTEIEARAWQDLPLTPPSDVHYCGGLQLMSDRRVLLYLNDGPPDHPGGFCPTLDDLKAYAADALAELEVEGPATQWARLPDGSHMTALRTRRQHRVSTQSEVESVSKPAPGAGSESG